MFDKKLKAAIQKYLDADTKNSKSGTKGAITKLINAASATDVMLIPGILQEFQGLPIWLDLRFKKGSLYQEGDRVFGWYKEGQVQAEPLPLRLYYQRFEDDRYCEVLDCAEEWETEGFSEAVPIPLSYWLDREVKVPVEQLRFYCEHGYASPCKLQWERKINRSQPEEDGYYVTRSIIPHGFWQAWKWWPDCWYWYYSKRPELFEDANLWGSLQAEPPNDPYAAVLGGSNKQYFKDRIFFLDD